jgi:hypothetical protein
MVFFNTEKDSFQTRWLNLLTMDRMKIFELTKHFTSALIPHIIISAIKIGDCCELGTRKMCKGVEGQAIDDPHNIESAERCERGLRDEEIHGWWCSIKTGCSIYLCESTYGHD